MLSKPNLLALPSPLEVARVPVTLQFSLIAPRPSFWECVAYSIGKLTILRHKTNLCLQIQNNTAAKMQSSSLQKCNPWNQTLESSSCAPCATWSPTGPWRTHRSWPTSWAQTYSPPQTRMGKFLCALQIPPTKLLPLKGYITSERPKCSLTTSRSLKLPKQTLHR